jgi:hypothetical protein
MTNEEIAPFFNKTQAYIQGNPDRRDPKVEGLVRSPGWQNTIGGEREAQKVLRKVIYVKYKIKDQDLFDKAYGYIRQYY